MTKFKAPHRATEAPCSIIRNGQDFSFVFSDNIAVWQSGKRLVNRVKHKRTPKGGDKTRTMRKLNDSMGCSEKYLFV